MDSKNQLNMGGSGRAFIADLKNGIVDARQEFRLFKQELQDAAALAQRFRDSMSNIRVGGGGGSASPNQVAPDPEFTPPQAAITAGGGGGGNVPVVPSGGSAMVPYGRGGNVVAYTPPVSGGTGGGGGGGFSGGNNLTDWIKENPAAGSLFAASAVSGMLTSPAEAVEAQLLMQRAAFFNSTGARGRAAAPVTQASLYGMGSVDYDRMRRLQENMAKTGTVTDSMDAMRALVAAQSYGITGPNVAGGAMGGVAMGVAQTSNLLPGIGAEGTMRAFGQMQQARNVNMLRGIGIRLRDEQGNLKPPDQIIDDLWNKICRDYSQAYGSGKKPSEREVLIGLQPGNSMDSMLDMYFGNDPMAKQLVANGLLFKAKSGGAAITKENLTQFGATTAATNAFSARQATAAEGLGQVANAGAFGFEKAAQVLTKLGAFMNMIDRVTGVLQIATGANAFATTLLGAGDGFMQKILSLLLGIKGAKAEGGDVGQQNMYLVGEKGPELFVPKVDGTIIPNHDLSKYNFKGGRADGGEVFAKDVLKGIGAPVTASNIQAMLNWEQGENTKARHNPLATTKTGYKGATPFNTFGDKGQYHVWNYTSHEQGVKATVDTLKLGHYKEIVSLLKEGDVPWEKIRASIKNSPWGTFKGSGGSGGSSGSVDAESVAKLFGIDPSSIDAKTLAQVNKLLTDPKYSKEVSSLKDFISGSWGSAGGTGGLAGLTGAGLSNVYNYGGVAINILGGNPKEIKRILTEVMKDAKILENASKK